ncbi:MAG: HlyD family efflux transporter periplasmic adaptor subunit [Oscillospiraceae bacterium]
MDNATLITPEKPQVQIPVAKKKKRWVKILIIVALLLALVFFVFVRPLLSVSDQLNSALYTAEKAQYRDLTVSVSGTATVLPTDSYKVTALVKGEILAAPFEEGDIVREGDLLYSIDPGDLENTIARTELSLQQAQLSYDQMLKSRTDQQVAATAGGTLQTLYVSVGDTVQPGSKIADILDRSSMTITLPFHSVAAQKFYVGQPATVTVTGSGAQLAATVTEISAGDQVGAGGTFIRNVKLSVQSPGTLDSAATATAQVGGSGCVSGGSFSYAAEKTIIAKASGEVLALNVRQGDTVANGQVLCQLDTSGLESQIENARLSLESARLSLENTRDQLENYQITSPLTGTVIEKNLKAGDNLDTTTSGYLAVVYDMSTLTFEIGIDEQDIGKIAVGQKVTMTAKALEGDSFTGHVSKININGVTSGGVTTYPVTVVIDNAGKLLPGMNVSAEIIVEEAINVLSVPVTAVGRGDTVQVLPADAYDKKGNPDYTRLVETPVKLGRNDANYIEVLSGLKEGDTVVSKQEISSMMEQMMNMGMTGGMSMGDAPTTGGGTPPQGKVTP